MKAHVLVLTVVLGAFFLVEGCHSVDERLLADTLEEVANLGSQAKCPGPRSQAEIDRTTAQVRSCQANVMRLAR